MFLKITHEPQVKKEMNKIFTEKWKLVDRGSHFSRARKNVDKISEFYKVIEDTSLNIGSNNVTRHIKVDTDEFTL